MLRPVLAHRAREVEATWRHVSASWCYILGSVRHVGNASYSSQGSLGKKIVESERHFNAKVAQWFSRPGSIGAVGAALVPCAVVAEGGDNDTVESESREQGSSQEAASSHPESNWGTIVGSEVIGAARWLVLKRITYRDREGRTRFWETCERTTRSATNPSTGVDGVGIVAIVRGRSGPESDRVVLVVQYRPPLGKPCIEVPAGLIDKGETAAEAAVRELREETGYEGRVLSVGSPIFNDPGLTNANCQLVLIEVEPKGGSETDTMPAQSLEEGEYVEVVLAPLQSLLGTLQCMEREHGYAIDARLYAFAFGLQASVSLLRPPAQSAS